MRFLLLPIVLAVALSLAARLVRSRLRRADRQQERFFNIALDMLCVAGFDGFFKRLNPAWERTLGWSPAELLARPYLEFVHPDDRATTLAEARKIAGGSPTVSFGNRYRCKDGSYRWLEWTAISDGKLIYAAAHDRTEHKRFDDARSEFVALASHQLRTPLTAVRWSLELLGEEAPPLTPAQRRLVNDAHEATVRMAETITLMLDVSRVESYAVRLRPADVDLLDLLDRVKAVHAAVCAGKGLSLSATCPPGLAVRTDPRLLEEILMNLVSNAVRYTPGGGSVRLEAARVEDGVEIAVTDTGIGVPTGERDRLFTRFFRAGNAVALEPGGTGLGLYLASALAGLLGGRLSFTPAAPRGTQFVLRLPPSPPAP